MYVHTKAGVTPDYVNQLVGPTDALSEARKGG